MTLGEYISKYREEHELSYDAFGKQVGISKQYVSILEKGINNEGKPVSPTVTTYAKIAKGTGVSETELMAMLDDTVKINPAVKLSPFTQKYAALDKHGKTVVDLVLDAEYQRCTKAEEVAEKPRTKIIPLFCASAGPGEPPSQDGFEDYEVDEDSPARFAVKISGDSMEPELHDGDIVLCRRKRPEIGELAVMMVNGAIYVKQYITDGINIYLRSINRKRKDCDVDIWSSGNDTVVGYGTVIHKKIPLVMQ